MPILPPQGPLRALIYNRASADPTSRALSVASQNDENTAYCHQQGWEIVGTVTDNDRSATRFATRRREGYEAVRAALAGSTRYGRVDVLVAWESSRAQRDLADYVAMRDLCVAHRVLFAYKGRVYDLRDGDDRFSTGMDALVDEREAERARDRTLRGHRASVAARTPRGFTPYGYRRVFDGRTGRLAGQQLDPDTAPVIAELARRVLAGDRLYRIAQDLNERDIPTPAMERDRRRGRRQERPGWSPAQIRNLLRNPTIAGIRTHHGEPVGPGTWEPIVDPDQFARIQALFADPTRTRNPRGVRPLYLLSGVARCGVCHAWLRPMTNRGRPTYACGGHVPTGPKGHVSAPRPAMDAVVVETFLQWCQRDDVGRLGMSTPGADEVADDAARDVTRLQARLDGFVASAAAGGVSPTALASIERELLPQIEAARRRAVPRVLGPLATRMMGPQARIVWTRELDLEDQRQVLRELARVTLAPATAVGAREFDPRRVDVAFTWGAATSPE